MIQAKEKEEGRKGDETPFPCSVSLGTSKYSTRSFKNQGNSSQKEEKRKGYYENQAYKNNPMSFPQILIKKH